MSGEPSLLCFAIGVIAKAPLPLEMENERPYLSSAYLGDIIAEAFANQEIVKVPYAVSYDGYCILALTFSLCTEGVA